MAMRERSTSLVTVPDLLERQQEMYADRPVMDVHNSHIGKIVVLLNQEIAELNGHTDHGMSLEKYREQETADIGWFTFALIRRCALNLDYAKVAEAGQQVIAQYALPDEKWSEGHEHAYEAIKERLGQHAQSLEWVKPHADVSEVSEKKAEVEHVIEEVLVYTWALFYLYGVNPEISMLEKMARNLVKHKGSLYRTPDTYEQAVRVAGAEWNSIHGNAQFYETLMYAPAEEPLLTEEERQRTTQKEHAVPLPRLKPHVVRRAQLNAQKGKELTEPLRRRHQKAYPPVTELALR